ncbi:LytTR family DNA-binding domain-containing protein [Flavobacterium sp. HSC-61S13]|uniref:LytR/AlgR family response regulator transcription factor n=1 Tax=Flavobacterium sp. HSC-61S13 TaxID=2910963 RepID=UPI0020A0F89E|nr:LytTR family DNA-binding domain-containing protein [Flavobacterium sp. HSC-61S13]MCP1996791.1 DNA-binding LytR/AlgR family response regulator [Flavobacterium sp. HSC-61S13]
MNVLIIEDEPKAARALKDLLAKQDSSIVFLNTIQSIAATVDFLKNEPSPDVIFMDVQLSDGLCFEILKEVEVLCPIIFCTAYSDYAMDAIKSNGIDYILKPYSSNDLKNSLDKIQRFRNHFTQKQSIPIDLLMDLAHTRTGKKYILVIKNNKYLSIATKHIAYIYVKYHGPTIVTFTGEEFDLDQSLDSLQSKLSQTFFFRVNRQYLISFSAIKEIEPYFSRKLMIRLTLTTPDLLLIRKEKKQLFLSWLDNR